MRQLGRLGGKRQKRQKRKFRVGRDCAERVMLTHLLQHWEWSIAEKLAAVTSKVYAQVGGWTCSRVLGP